MDFIANRSDQNEEMLKAIGVSRFEELLATIPKELIHERPSGEDGLSESEGIAAMEQLAHENGYLQMDSYLGAGAYAHYIPAIVSTITSRSEFLTSYTPYQAEASQGLLQALFEYQSTITALTKMDASNASVYDAASACAEACLMAIRSDAHHTKRIALSEGVNPLYRKVIEQYLSGLKIEIETVSLTEGKTDWKALNKPVACVLYQSPNFFGWIEQAPDTVTAPKICCGNPMSFALFTPPGEQQIDICVGDLQPLGLPLSFGGPYAGFMTCKEPWIRKLPGRIVGRTADAEGKEGYVLTLQAREQHIRREKATSNICTNQTLAAIAFLVTTLWYGPKGLKKLALTNYQRAHYLHSKLKGIAGIHVDTSQDFFNEFVVRFDQPIEHVLKHFRNAGIDPGLPLNRFFPERTHELLVAVTELKDLAHLNRYIQIAEDLS